GTDREFKAEDRRDSGCNGLRSWFRVRCRGSEFRVPGSGLPGGCLARRTRNSEPGTRNPELSYAELHAVLSSGRTRASSYARAVALVRILVDGYSLSHCWTA